MTKNKSDKPFNSFWHLFESVATLPNSGRWEQEKAPSPATSMANIKSSLLRQPCDGAGMLMASTSCSTRCCATALREQRTGRSLCQAHDRRPGNHASPLGADRRRPGAPKRCLVK
ncbi:MAG TPA: hypothetical protein VIH42_03350 [Thermoguttaceae bacterium]